MIESGKYKRGSLIVSLFAVMAFVSCAGVSDTRTKDPNGGNLGKLDRFVGKWEGYASKSTNISGQIGIESRWMKVVVKPVTTGIVELEGDIWEAKGILKYDTSSDKYAFSFEADGFPQLPEFPMTFSEADGFLGSSTFTQNGKAFDAKVTIKDEKGDSDLNLGITQGKDKWNLGIPLGKVN